MTTLDTNSLILINRLYKLVVTREINHPSNFTMKELSENNDLIKEIATKGLESSKPEVVSLCQSLIDATKDKNSVIVSDNLSSSSASTNEEKSDSPKLLSENKSLAPLLAEIEVLCREIGGPIGGSLFKKQASTATSLTELISIFQQKLGGDFSKKVQVIVDKFKSKR